MINVGPNKDIRPDSIVVFAPSNKPTVVLFTVIGFEMARIFVASRVALHPPKLGLHPPKFGFGRLAGCVAVLFVVMIVSPVAIPHL
jgi:hypothetical protein